MNGLEARAIMVRHYFIELKYCIFIQMSDCSKLFHNFKIPKHLS